MKTVLIFRNLPGLIRGTAPDILCLLLAVLLILPVLSIGLTALEDNRGLFGHLLTTVLPGYFVNTLMLMAGVGALVLLFGISTAWIVSRYDFPLRRLLEWMLVLPAAVPAYLVAYTYTDFLEYAGPVQTMLRDATGWRTARDYWFPEIRSIGGAMLVMAAVLYPYVYITARTGFRLTSTRLFEAAIITGRQNLLMIALPLARPGIMAGLALVLMEVVSDFGTVEYFAVDTITLGIFNVWLGMNNMPLAAQLAVLSFSLILLLLWFERSSQSHRRVQNAGRGTAGVPLKRAEGIWVVLLPLGCLFPILLGFGIPVGVLLGFVTKGVSGAMPAGSLAALGNTLIVALLASVAIMVVAGFMGVNGSIQDQSCRTRHDRPCSNGLCFSGHNPCHRCADGFRLWRCFSALGDPAFRSAYHRQYADAPAGICHQVSGCWLRHCSGRAATSAAEPDVGQPCHGAWFRDKCAAGDPAPDAAVIACRTADRLCRYHEGITDDIAVAAVQFRNAGNSNLSVCQGRNARGCGITCSGDHSCGACAGDHHQPVIGPAE